MFKYEGKTIEIKYESGYHFKIEYLPGNKLKWTSLKERTDGIAMTDKESFYLNQQGDGIFTLSWIENSGYSITQNLDFDKMTVYAFMSWNDSSARGGRAVLSHRGIISFIE